MQESLWEGADLRRFPPDITSLSMGVRGSRFYTIRRSPVKLPKKVWRLTENFGGGKTDFILHFSVKKSILTQVKPILRKEDCAMLEVNAMQMPGVSCFYCRMAVLAD